MLRNKGPRGRFISSHRGDGLLSLKTFLGGRFIKALLIQAAILHEVDIFFEKIMLPLKNLRIFCDHFDSGTARNGEFLFFPKISNFGFSVTDPRKMSQVDIFFEKMMLPLKNLRIFW